MNLLFIFLGTLFWEFFEAWFEVVFLQGGFAFLSSAQGHFKLNVWL